MKLLLTACKEPSMQPSNVLHLVTPNICSVPMLFRYIYYIFRLLKCLTFPKRAVGETCLDLLWTNMSVVHSPEISIAVFSLNLGELDLPSYAGVFERVLSIEQGL